MLVLSRRPGERILIGDEIAVTIVRVTPNNVRLGITAPKAMNIVREELLETTPSPASACRCRMECRDGDTVMRECEACKRNREDE